MSLPRCKECGRQFVEGEPAWGREYHVIDMEGVTTVTKYTCLDCEPE